MHENCATGVAHKQFNSHCMRKRLCVRLKGASHEAGNGKLVEQIQHFSAITNLSVGFNIFISDDLHYLRVARRHLQMRSRVNPPS